MNKLDFTSTPLQPGSNDPFKAAQTALATQRPIPFLPSSSLSRMDAKAAEAGCFDRVKQLFQLILGFFGLSSTPTTTSTTQTTALDPPTYGVPGTIAIGVRELQERISRGKQIIDSQFRSNFIVNAASPRSAIVVAITYNYDCEVRFGNAQTIRNERDATKAMLQDLLHRQSTRHTDSSDAHALSVITFLIEKNGADSFN